MKILTFDIEDWFHILDYNETKNVKNWNNFESRINIGLEKILSTLESKNIKATFFILGWIANKYPEIVKRIDDMGFQIGSHTHLHQLIYSQSPSEFDSDLYKSINTLQDLTGKKVELFRAPGFSIKKSNLWTFEILCKNGIKIDSSIFPAIRSHGGIKDFNEKTPCIIDYKGIKIKEFPINTFRFFKHDFVFSGGGYFRFFPYYLIKKLSYQSEYVMTYFHPRDFDPDQPVLKNMSFFRKFKTYTGLSKSYIKLNQYVDDFQFIDIDNADKIIDWKNSRIIKLN